MQSSQSRFAARLDLSDETDIRLTRWGRRLETHLQRTTLVCRKRKIMSVAAMPAFEMFVMTLPAILAERSQSIFNSNSLPSRIVFSSGRRRTAAIIEMYLSSLWPPPSGSCVH